MQLIRYIFSGWLLIYDERKSERHSFSNKLLDREAFAMNLSGICWHFVSYPEALVTAHRARHIGLLIQFLCLKSNICCWLIINFHRPTHEYCINYVFWEEELLLFFQVVLCLQENMVSWRMSYKMNFIFCNQLVRIVSEKKWSEKKRRKYVKKSTKRIRKI